MKLKKDILRTKEKNEEQVISQKPRGEEGESLKRGVVHSSKGRKEVKQDEYLKEVTHFGNYKLIILKLFSTA